MAGSIDIAFVSFEDLMVMKRQAGRPQDLLDIENLKQLKEGQADG